MHGPGEGALVLDRAGEPVELRAGLVLDRLAPEIDDAPRAGRRFEARQPLAHHHGHRILQRRLVAVARFRRRALVIAVVEHGGEVRRHALHAPRADRLDARLLHRVEQRPRGRALRRVAAVDRLAVAGEPQRHRIRHAAQDGGLASVGLARRLGQARLGAFGPARQAGLVGAERDFELGMARHRARAGRKRALERLVAGFRFLAGLAVAGGLDVDAWHLRLICRGRVASQARGAARLTTFTNPPWPPFNPLLTLSARRPPRFSQGATP